MRFCAIVLLFTGIIAAEESNLALRDTWREKMRAAEVECLRLGSEPEYRQSQNGYSGSTLVTQDNSAQIAQWRVDHKRAADKYAFAQQMVKKYEGLVFSSGKQIVSTDGLSDRERSRIGAPKPHTVPESAPPAEGAPLKPLSLTPPKQNDREFRALTLDAANWARNAANTSSEADRVRFTEIAETKRAGINKAVKQLHDIDIAIKIGDIKGARKSMTELVDAYPGAEFFFNVSENGQMLNEWLAEQRNGGGPDFTGVQK